MSRFFYASIAFCSTQCPATAVSPCEREDSYVLNYASLCISTFKLVSNGNFHSQPFQPKKHTDSLPNLKSWSSFTAKPAHLPVPPPSLAALLNSAAEKNCVGKRAVVFIWLLFISLCRYGSKFRELILNDLASKTNPFSKSSQNISPLTNSKWKPFIVQNGKVFLI